MIKRKEIYNGTKENMLWHDRWIYPQEHLLHIYDKDKIDEWVDMNKKEEVSNEEVIRRRKEELLNLDFKDLRIIGYQYNQKDRDKTKLIEEIIKEQLKRGEF